MRIDLTDLPCDKTTARRVMMVAYERCEHGDADIRAVMAEVVRDAVEAWIARPVEPSFAAKIAGTAPGTRTVASMRDADLRAMGTEPRPASGADRCGCAECVAMRRCGR